MVLIFEFPGGNVREVECDVLPRVDDRARSDSATYRVVSVEWRFVDRQAIAWITLAALQSDRSSDQQARVTDHVLQANLLRAKVFALGRARGLDRSAIESACARELALRNLPDVRVLEDP